jgi:hypothetical protein
LWWPQVGFCRFAQALSPPKGSITIGNLGIAMLEPSLPLWMMESWSGASFPFISTLTFWHLPVFSASSFERGAAFLVRRRQKSLINFVVHLTVAGLRLLSDWHKHLWLAFYFLLAFCSFFFLGPLAHKIGRLVNATFPVQL